MKKVFICLLVLGILIAFHPNETRAQEDPIEKLKNAAKADPKDYAPHFGLGQAYHIMGIYDKAITEYKKVIELEPLFAAALLSPEESVLENVPNLSDIRFMAEILTELGAEIERLDQTTWNYFC